MSELDTRVRIKDACDVLIDFHGYTPDDLHALIDEAVQEHQEARDE